MTLFNFESLRGCSLLFVEVFYQNHGFSFFLNLQFQCLIHPLSQEKSVLFEIFLLLILVTPILFTADIFLKISLLNLKNRLLKPQLPRFLLLLKLLSHPSGSWVLSLDPFFRDTIGCFDIDGLVVGFPLYFRSKVV